MSTAKQTVQRFKVGDWVWFGYGTWDAYVQIIEDRGPLGVGGRRLYRLRLDSEDGEPDLFELAADDLNRVPQPKNSELIKYFKDGGLVRILQENLISPSDRRKVWISYTRRGEMTHTLDPRRGVMGGGDVPYFALHEHHVFRGKQKEVIEFLMTFGLSRTEAAEVVAAVGTAP